MSYSQHNTEDSVRVAPANKARLFTIRWVNVILALVVAVGLLTSGETLARKARFALAGTVRSQGFTLRLDPKDEMITPYILTHGNYEPAETSVIRSLLRPGQTFVDVGANI